MRTVSRKESMTIDELKNRHRALEIRIKALQGYL